MPTLQERFDAFLQEADRVHQGKYLYDKVEYKNAQTKICIICSIHGEFWQTPNKHLRGQGCPKCSGRNKITCDIIKEFQMVHGESYDYSEVEYLNAKTKVKILCPKHGYFLQTPNKHLLGQGCPLCKESHLEQEVRCFLIENNIKFESQKHFDWLGKQSLDFYLPDYNIGIECQGIQHFEPTDFSSNNIQAATKNFEIIRRRDSNKKTLCESNHIKLLFYNNLNKYSNLLGNKVFHSLNELLSKITESK